MTGSYTERPNTVSRRHRARHGQLRVPLKIQIFRPSREGGNPEAIDSLGIPKSLDSRLRGNDEFLEAPLSRDPQERINQQRIGTCVTAGRAIGDPSRHQHGDMVRDLQGPFGILFDQ
jgi:hypothetical protein